MVSKTNIPLRKYRKALKHLGLTHVKTTGGHEKWEREDLMRPVIVQTHVDPVPFKIVKSNCKTLGISVGEFLKIVNR